MFLTFFLFPGGVSLGCRSGRDEVLRGKRAPPNTNLIDCFRCAVKTRGLEKGNAEEAEFFFIWGVWGYVGFCLPRRSVHFAKDGAVLRWFVLGRDGPLRKTTKRVKH